MRINFKNILGVIFAIWLSRNFKPVVAEWFNGMRGNNEFWDKHPALPSMMLALVCVTVVAVFKLRSEQKK